MSTVSNSSSEDLSSLDKNPFRGRFARAFFSSCMGLPRNNAAYAANSDFEWDTVSGESDDSFRFLKRCFLKILICLFSPVLVIPDRSAAWEVFH